MKKLFLFVALTGMLSAVSVNTFAAITHKTIVSGGEEKDKKKKEKTCTHDCCKKNSTTTTTSSTTEKKECCKKDGKTCDKDKQTNNSAPSEDKK